MGSTQAAIDPDGGTRRDFAKALTGVLAAPFIAADKKQQKTANKPSPPTAVRTPGEILAELARARYGRFLTPEQQKAVERSVRRRLASASQLNRVKLTNGDEPAVVFSPFGS